MENVPFRNSRRRFIGGLGVGMLALSTPIQGWADANLAGLNSSYQGPTGPIQLPKTCCLISNNREKVI